MVGALTKSAGLRMTTKAFLGSAISEALGSLTARYAVQRPSLQDLRQLVALRTLAIVAYSLTLVMLYHVGPEPIPADAIAAVLVVLAALNFATWWRLDGNQSIGNRELLLQLLVDVGAPTALLTMAGGPSGALAGLFALPLALMVANLSSSCISFMALAVLVCSSFVAFACRPLLGLDEALHQQLLASAVWVGFAVAAGFAWRWAIVAKSQLHSARTEANSRRREACEERIALIGTLAAGAAHELAQPLSSLSVIARELRDRCAGREELQDLHHQMDRQLQQCRDTLGGLLAYSNRTFEGPLECVDVERFARQVLDRFRARRRHVHASLRVAAGSRALRVRTDPGLRQALLSLLNNAADASPNSVELGVAWDDEQLWLTVLDDGPGIPPEMEKKIGQMFFTTKPKGKGHGLGLFLAHIAVARLGGSLRLFNTLDRGACAEVVLPVRTMTSDAVPREGPG